MWRFRHKLRNWGGSSWSVLWFLRGEAKRNEWNKRTSAQSIVPSIHTDALRTDQRTSTLGFPVSFQEGSSVLTASHKSVLNAQYTTHALGEMCMVQYAVTYMEVRLSYMSGHVRMGLAPSD
ncbi:hypothetical protein J6590_054823 [Homalodisca vitripennis]|nr:hypothetical protein J6590_054823 [Homalodisca vitripennis]